MLERNAPPSRTLKVCLRLIAAIMLVLGVGSYAMFVIGAMSIANALQSGVPGATRMKRDMDLVREILLYAEQHATPSNPCSVKIEGHSEEEVSYHLRLMRDAGLIDARTPGGSIWAVLGLTWAGHELLDAARDDSRWSKAKKTLADKAGSVRACTHKRPKGRISLVSAT